MIHQSVKNKLIEKMNLLEKVKGERTPDVSLAAQPKALFGCSNSGCVAIIFSSCSTFVLGARSDIYYRNNTMIGGLS